MHAAYTVKYQELSYIHVTITAIYNPLCKRMRLLKASILCNSLCPIFPQELGTAMWAKQCIDSQINFDLKPLVSREGE